MQYINKINTQADQKISLITKYFALSAICVILWLLPITGNLIRFLDAKIYFSLNNSLLHSNLWQNFWGYLNHPNENWMNVIFMVGINFYAIFALPSEKRLKSFADVLYFWLFFQIVLFVTYQFFSSWLVLDRWSPSIVQEPVVQLSDALGIDGIKVYSNNSFPAGHALVLIYWASFTLGYCSKSIKKVVLSTVLVLGMARLFSGAHWSSDILFTTFFCLSLRHRP